MHVPQQEGPLVAQPPFFTNTGIPDRFSSESNPVKRDLHVGQWISLAVGDRVLFAFHFCVPCRCDEAAAPCLHPSPFAHTLLSILPSLLLPPDKPGCKGLGSRD